MYYTKDKGYYKLIYLDGYTKHFARISEKSQKVQFDTYYDANYYPFNHHTFYEVKWARLANEKNVEALLLYIKSQPDKQKINLNVTKLTSYSPGKLEFTLSDANGSVDLAFCEFTKQSLRVDKYNVKFADTDLQGKFDKFLKDLEPMWNASSATIKPYIAYNIKAFKRQILAKVKNA